MFLLVQVEVYGLEQLQQAEVYAYQCLIAYLVQFQTLAFYKSGLITLKMYSQHFDVILSTLFNKKKKKKKKFSKKN